MNLPSLIYNHQSHMALRSSAWRGWGVEWQGHKPSSVPAHTRRMVIYLGWRSLVTSSGLPAAQATRARSRRLFGLAPTGGCRATAVTGRAVGSYPTISPLPAEAGGVLSVALSVALRRPGVTWQSALWSSDFPRPACASRDHHALPLQAPSAAKIVLCAVGLKQAVEPFRFRAPEPLRIRGLALRSR